MATAGNTIAWIGVGVVKHRRLNKRIAMLLFIAVNLIQVGLLVLLFFYSFIAFGSLPNSLENSIRFFLIIIAFTTLINALFSIRDIRLLFRTDTEYRLLQDALSKVENLNNSLRAQRHDFLNHLQVVYGLMEMEEYGDARDYIGRVYKDIQKVSRALKTANPAINALLQAKLLDAEKKNIHMEIDVASRFEKLPIPSWEFCRVLGNLLDNAIQALEEEPENKLVKIRLEEDLKNLIVHVEDNGPMIPPDLFMEIFKPGFTTKKGQGEGMGLAITKNIMEKYGGNIQVSSSHEATIFTASVPKPAVDLIHPENDF